MILPPMARHSTVTLVQAHGGGTGAAYYEPPSDRYKVTWMVRNEDFFFLRWCAHTIFFLRHPFQPAREREGATLDSDPGVFDHARAEGAAPTLSESTSLPTATNMSAATPSAAREIFPLSTTQRRTAKGCGCSRNR